MLMSNADLKQKIHEIVAALPGDATHKDIQCAILLDRIEHETHANAHGKTDHG